MPSPLLQGPPAEHFWTKYSNRHEFPLSTAGAVLLHVGAAAFIVFVLFGLANRTPDRAAVPMMLVDDGHDDTGEGTPTPGGETALQKGESNPFETRDTDLTPDPTRLPDAVPSLPDLPPTPDGAAVPDTSPLGNLDKLLPKGLPGGKRGAGDKKGDGQPGGADSTKARNNRWTLRFRTASGEDYLSQLAVLKASVIVPIPPGNKEFLYFTDPKDPKSGRKPTAADTRLIAGQVKFSDSRVESVKGVTATLKLDFAPKVYWAVFPKDIEDELVRTEKAYRNRRPEDIEETMFRVTVTDGKYTIVVDDQKVKR